MGLQEKGEEFFRKAASNGKVLIISNATEGTALAGWSCERFSQEFPDAKMRREYDWEKNPKDKNLQKLGNGAWAESLISGEDSKDRLKQDPNAPPFAPFYWGVREHHGGAIGSKKVVKRIRELITKSVPKFMDKANAESLFEHAEFWMGANGTGARAHMDSHCISTLSMVLHGARRWRIGPVPRLPTGAGRSPEGEVVFDDGVAYKLGWKPMFEFTVYEGEAVLFPPGWIHETLNVASGCTVAMTTQFTVPFPVGYFRSYYNRLRRVGDLNPCWKRQQSWAALGKATKTLPKNGKDARAQAEKLFTARKGGFSREEKDFYDLDGDGEVGHDELVDTYVAWVASEAAVRKEKKKRSLGFDMSLDEPKGKVEL